VEIERVQQNRLGGETLSWQYTTLCKLWEHVAGTTRPKPSEAELKKSKTLFRKVIIPKVAVGIPLRYGTYTNREKIFMSTYQFITAKEMIYLLNTTSRNYLRGGVEAPALQPILAEIISMDQFSIAMAVSIEFEQSLERVTEESDKTVFYLGSHCLSRNFDVDMGSDIDDIKGTGPESIEPLAAYKLANPTHKSCIPIVIKECYRALNLIHFYVLVPGRELTVYCLRQGATIVEAASKVDENIARNFIRGEVMIYDELRDLNGDKVKLMMTGGVKAQAKKYIVNDGDIIEFFYHGREKPL
jgi:ribosome-binding ATPase YchF (GTP1/OBG family)